jgi:23S rRNA (uridine2552-2'-O)-methyltransferase
MRELHDHFFRQARLQGYRSRAAFKLIEIDERRRLLRRGSVVLDAGCAPGSWLQVAAARVGPPGRVIGVDLKECDPRGLAPNVRLVQGDLRDVTLAELLGGVAPEPAGGAAHRVLGEEPAPPFDVILSDMGPDTTGDPSGDSARSIRLCHDLLDRAGLWLRLGGHLAMKVYEGGDYPELLRRTRSLFAEAKGYKPESSRDESVEIYLIGRGWRGAERSGQAPAQQPAGARPRGWRTSA